MSGLETRISTPNEFARVQVYQLMGPGGPVMRVVFENPEEGDALGKLIFGIVGYAGLAVIAVSLFGLPVYLYGVVGPTGSVIAFVAAFVGGILFARWIASPFTIHREIQLDFPGDELRVLRNGARTEMRKLSRLQNLTIERHPETEIEYRKLQGRLGPKQKQHCLVGWFGAGGAEKVPLVYRWEWPNQESLFEVRQAVLWAADKAAGKGMDKDGTQAPAKQIGGGIKPPLD